MTIRPTGWQIEKERERERGGGAAAEKMALVVPGKIEKKARYTSRLSDGYKSQSIHFGYG